MISVDIVINLGIGKIVAHNSEGNLEMMIEGGEDLKALHRALLQVIDTGIFEFKLRKKKSRRRRSPSS